MKHLTQLTAASATDGPDPKPSLRQGVHLAGPNQEWINVGVADECILVRSRRKTVCIPIAALIELASAHEPDFCQKPK